MPRILTASEEPDGDKAMREWRQEPRKSVQSSRSPLKEISPSGHVSPRSIAVQHHIAGTNIDLSYERQDTRRDGELAFAVCKSAYVPKLGIRDRKRLCRVVEDVSDELLLKRVAEGDKAAMHIIFARHRARVFRFIQRMIRNPTIAEDVVSQVFLAVWRSAKAFEHRARVSTWLLSIARFRSIISMRERTHESIDHVDVLGVVDPEDTPEAALHRKEANGALQVYIDKLSPAHRETIDLFYYHGKSVAEMSKLIGIPQATIKSRLFYARKHLASVLLSAGFEPAGSGDAALSIAHRVTCNVSIDNDHAV